MVIAVPSKLKWVLCVALGLSCAAFTLIGVWLSVPIEQPNPTSTTTPSYQELEIIWAGDRSSGVTFTLGRLWADQAGLISSEERKTTTRAVQYDIHAYLKIDRALPATSYREEQVPNCTLTLLILDRVQRRQITVEEMPFDLKSAAHDAWQSSPVMPPRVKQTLALVRSIESGESPPVAPAAPASARSHRDFSTAAFAAALLALIALVILLVTTRSADPSEALRTDISA